MTAPRHPSGHDPTYGERAAARRGRHRAPARSAGAGALAAAIRNAGDAMHQSERDAERQAETEARRHARRLAPHVGSDVAIYDHDGHPAVFGTLVGIVRGGQWAEVDVEGTRLRIGNLGRINRM